MNINLIIKETLDKYLRENVITEKKMSHESTIEQQRKAKIKGGEKASGSDKERIQNILQNDALNLSQIADDVPYFEDHASEESKQSHLRKMVTGEKPMPIEVSKGVEYALMKNGINPEA